MSCFLESWGQLSLVLAELANTDGTITPLAGHNLCYGHNLCQGALNLFNVQRFEA